MMTTIDYLKQLIAFDTTSRKSNLELIDWVKEILQAQNIRCDLTFDRERNKANLFATLGASSAPGVVLSGHTDVVPVDGQNWSDDPFQVQLRDGRLYGRGSCDMKGFIAACLSRVEDILEADLPLPVHFAFSYDEEVGCLGVQGLLDDLEARSIRPTACIIGEPTSMRVVCAHKGMLMQRCCVRGKSAHSSLLEQGVNAVAMAAKAISYIDDMAERIRREGPFDAGFEPPYTTLHCGVVHGGTVNNIIPHRCQFEFEIRSLPGQQAWPLFEQVQRYVEQELEPRMQAVDAQCGFDWQTLADFPGLETPPEERLVAELSALLNTTEAPGKVSYGTEGGLFQQAGIRTLICGPGSIEQAHKPDEYVELQQLQQADAFLSALVRSLK